MHLPSNFQDEVREFLIFTHGTKDEQQELKNFLKMISPSLKEQVAIFIFANVVVINPRLKRVFDINLEEALKLRPHVSQMGLIEKYKKGIVTMFVRKLTTKLIQPEDVIVQQEEESTDMFIIAKGECEVNIMDESKKNKLVRILRSGDYFGEISLIYGCKRTGSVISRKYSTLAKLTQEKY